MEIVHQLDWPAGSFQIVLGDLLQEPVDCIVNAANGQMVHGGGVAAVIARAAGPALDKACRDHVATLGPVPTGSAMTTTAGNLPFKAVIHAVGPRLGDGDEQRRVCDALLAAFGIAHESGFESCAFPAISSGVFAVPHVVCARGYRDAVEGFYAGRPNTPLRLIRLCLLGGPMVDVARAAF